MGYPASRVLHYTETPFAGSLGGRLTIARGGGGVSLYWLGQAGFLIETSACRLLIDPYLSDSLAAKYRGKAFSHERMMAAPIAVAELPPVDLVLCTHHHTDHMDGETLAAIAARFAGARFVVPQARYALAGERIGITGPRLIGVDAGGRLDPGHGVTLTVLRAAHEELERDEAGHHVFLGYGIEVAGVRLLHSGDTIPFAGQIEEMAAFGADLALLPVNGRSQTLRATGIAGNFTLDEAVGVARQAHIPRVLAHHYGMFAFNTIAPDAIDAKIGQGRMGVDLHRAQAGIEYRLEAQ